MVEYSPKLAYRCWVGKGLSFNERGSSIDGLKWVGEEDGTSNNSNQDSKQLNCREVSIRSTYSRSSALSITQGFAREASRG